MSAPVDVLAGTSRRNLLADCRTQRRYVMDDRRHPKWAIGMPLAELRHAQWALVSIRQQRHANAGGAK